jgi:hypothetical protein
MRTSAYRAMTLSPLLVLLLSQRGRTLLILALLAVRPGDARANTMSAPVPFITGYAATNPHGTAISSAPPGAPILIEGMNLGTGGTLSFGLDAANGPAPPAALSWSPSEILTTVPSAPTYPYTAPLILVISGQRVAGPALTITQPIPIRDNLLVNGGFELPDSSGSSTGDGGLYGAAATASAGQAASILGWQIVQGNVRLVSQAWRAAEGSQSLALVGTAGPASIAQTVYVLPGQEYLFSGFISHDATVASGRAKLLLNGAEVTELADDGPAPPDNSRWRAFSYRFTAPFTRGSFGLLTLRISDSTGLGNTGGPDLDGLTVTLAPPLPAPPAPPTPAPPPGPYCPRGVGVTCPAPSQGGASDLDAAPATS